jgi:hypothetical protein
MNHNEHPHDSALARELRDSLSALAAPERPSLAAITGRGRVRQRRRLATFGGLAATGAAAGIALAVGLTGASGAPPALSTGTGTGTGASTGASQAAASSGGTGVIRTAAFTLTSNGNGTTTLTLPMKQVLDPAVFQRALRQDGIPALVKSGVDCTSRLEPANPIFNGTITIKSRYKPPQPGGSAPRGGVPSPGQLLADAVAVINPAKIPAGAELFFGYSRNDRAMAIALIDVNSYACKSQPPLPPPPGE